MQEPTRLRNGEGRRGLGQTSDDIQSVLPGQWRQHADTGKSTATRETSAVRVRDPQQTLREEPVWPLQVAERPVVVKKPGNAGGAKGP